jgi:predicted YcjX-like family ATPase
MDINERKGKIKLWAEVGVAAFEGNKQVWYTTLVPYEVPDRVVAMTYEEQKPLIFQEFWSKFAREDDNVIVHIWVNRIVALPEDLTPMKLEATL